MQLSLFNTDGLRELNPPAYVYFEYFFLISPNEKVKKDVVAFKKKLNSTIGISKTNMHSVPHLSLLLIREKMCCDNLIINKAMRALKHEKRFDVEIEGAKVFDHTRTKSLVLDIANSQSPKNIYKALVSEFFFPPSDEMVEDFNPHITIARSIPFSDFYRVIHPLSEFHYKGDFHCDHIKLLRRTVTKIGKKVEAGPYTPIFDIPLCNVLK